MSWGPPRVFVVLYEFYDETAVLLATERLDDALAKAYGEYEAERHRRVVQEWVNGRIVATYRTVADPKWYPFRVDRTPVSASPEA